MSGIHLSLTSAFLVVCKVLSVQPLSGFGTFSGFSGGARLPDSQIEGADVGHERGRKQHVPHELRLLDAERLHGLCTGGGMSRSYMSYVRLWMHFIHSCRRKRRLWMMGEGRAVYWCGE